MCGICGWIGTGADGSHEATLCMTEVLSHRGPDDQGMEEGKGWGLGFRRLSILDLSPLGHQPMRSRDGRFIIVFNGEIYNYVELRRALEQEGESFRSGSDTEVLLRLLARQGADALSRLNGMFALAFIDTHERTFLLARDRLGVKPLYYTVNGNSLRFASELKALLAWPGARREIDPSAIAEYMALGYLPSETCIFSGYGKIPPGHFMAGELDAPQKAAPVPYWRVRLNEDATRRPLAASELEELEDLLQDAVRIRLRSDVPVGVFLSGGVDSGLVAALSAKVSGRSPMALTVGFSEQEADETDLARATAEHVGIEHRVIQQKPVSLADLDRLAWTFDEPFGDPSALPTFALCEAAREHATVYLSGDGGDEAFGGYRRYIQGLRLQGVLDATGRAAWGVRALARVLPATSLPHYRLLKLALPDQGAAAAFDGLPHDPATWLVLNPALRPRSSEASIPLWARWSASRGSQLTARQQYLDYSLYLPDDVLVKVDRASMANSIEVRSPFLDYRLVEWAARLPRSTLLNTQEGKLPLKALGRRLLPDQVNRGAKKGFGVPLGEWFRQPAGVSLIKERLLSHEGLRFGFWDSKGVQRILREHQAPGGRDFGLLFWRMLMLDAWARQYAGHAQLEGKMPCTALSA